MSRKHSENGYHDNYAYQMPKNGGKGTRGGQFEDVSSYSSSKGKGGKKKSTTRRVVSILLAVVFSLCIVAGAALIYVSTYLLGDLNTTSLTKNKAELGIASDIISSSEIKNIALFGVDSRSEGESARSDSIMILSLDMKHKKVKLTSVARDSYVPVEGYGYTKITHAYAYGGYQLAVKTLNQNFNMDIMDYVTIDFRGLASIIDAIGGVDLNITSEERDEINRILYMTATDDPSLGLNPYEHLLSDDQYGDVHMDGYQAVSYARIRYLDSDFGRMDRQQNVMQAMFNQVMAVSKTEYPKMVKTLAGYCETSMNIGDILPLVQLVLSNFTIERLSLPSDSIGYSTPTIDGMSVVQYDLETAAHQLDAFIKEQDSPYWSDFYSTGGTDEGNDYNNGDGYDENETNEW